MAHGEPVPKFVRGYTTALMVLGIFFVFGIVTHQWLIGQEDTEPDLAGILRFVRNIEVVLALLCIGAAVLRAQGARIAPTVTAAVSIVLAFGFPVGTAVFAYWILSVRPRERVQPTDAAAFD
jgi:hypothetical protein